MNTDWAVNKTKLNIAITRANDKVTLARATNPGKEIPDASEEDVKAEYIKLAGLLYNDEAVAKLEEQVSNTDRSARPFVQKGLENFKAKVAETKAKKTKKAE